MFSRYVVGVDGSSPSQAALRWAADRAIAAGAPLLLVHVEEPEAGLMGEDYAREDLRAGAALLADLTASLSGRGIDLTATLTDGPVAWALADIVRSDDLLVIGTHKTGFLHGRVLGSRSVQIAAVAPCSVAVIPDVDLRFRQGVVVGIDDDADSPTVALAAAAEASARSDQLSMIMSIARGAHRKALRGTEAVRAVHESYPGLTVRMRESQRPPAEALLDSSRDKAMLVLGPGMPDRMLSPIGSVLHDVLLNLNAPALIVRAASAEN